MLSHQSSTSSLQLVGELLCSHHHIDDVKGLRHDKFETSPIVGSLGDVDRAVEINLVTEFANGPAQVIDFPFEQHQGDRCVGHVPIVAIIFPDCEIAPFKVLDHQRDAIIVTVEFRSSQGRFMASPIGYQSRLRSRRLTKV